MLFGPCDLEKSKRRQIPRCVLLTWCNDILFQPLLARTAPWKCGRSPTGASPGPWPSAWWTSCSTSGRWALCCGIPPPRTSSSPLAATTTSVSGTWGRASVWSTSSCPSSCWAPAGTGTAPRSSSPARTRRSGGSTPGTATWRRRPSPTRAPRGLRLSTSRMVRSSQPASPNTAWDSTAWEHQVRHIHRSRVTSAVQTTCYLRSSWRSHCDGGYGHQ